MEGFTEIPDESGFSIRGWLCYQKPIPKVLRLHGLREMKKMFGGTKIRKIGMDEAFQKVPAADFQRISYSRKITCHTHREHT